MKHLLSKKLFGLIVVFLVSISTLSAHGVQLRWNIVPSTGAIRVWIEHWHGRATNVANFPLIVTSSVGGVTTTQTYYATGYINGSSVAGLPDGGSTSDLLSSCGGYSGANTQNNWVFWDFNPPACNTPVSLTIVSGPAVETTEACATLYPQTITSNFNDNNGPALTCNDVNVPPTGANCDAVVSSYNIGAVDACGGNVSLSYSIAEGSTFAQGTTPVTATALDQYGNSSTCTFNVNVLDNQAPTVITQNTSKKLINGNATISATDIDNGSFDGNTCGGIATISVAPSSFDCNDVGTNSVVLTVTDISGNISTGTATVTILDTVAPVITCTANLTVNADPGECTAIATFGQPTVTDNCAGSSSVTINQIAGLTSGSRFPVGSTTNTFVVSDGSGINDTCSFDVTVTQSNPLAISIADTVKVCQGSSVQLSPTILNVPQTSGGSGNGNASFCVFDAAGGAANCTFGTQSLCTDGYVLNPGTKTLSNVSLPGTPSSMGIRIYFTKCGSTATNWTFKLNGQVIGTYSNSLNSCSCQPPTSQYPSSINIPTSQFISAWNQNGSNTFSIEYTGDSPYISGYVVDMSYDTESYSWTGNAGISDAASNNPTVSPTASGYYYVSYQGTNGCTASDSVYAEIVALPTVSLSPLGAVSLYGGIVNLSGGSPTGGTYSGAGVSNNQFDPSIAGLGFHTITYTYTNSEGCSSSDSSSIEVIPCNIQLSATSSNVSCPRGSDGTIDLNATNTNGAVTYQWTGPAGFTASTEDLSGLAAGNYTVIVTDANACTETSTYSVVDNVDNTPPTVLTQNVSVYLDANGQGALSSTSTTTPIFSEDWAGVSPGFYSNTQVGAFNISGSIDVGDYIAGMPGTEIDLAGNANATMETSASFYLQAGSYTFTLDHQTNTNPNPNNSVRVIIGSSFDQTFTSINSIKKESVDFTVAAAENATIKVIQLGPSDASGTFIGSLGLGYNNPAVIEIDGGSTDNCGVLSITASQTNFTCADVGAQPVTLTVTDVNGNSASNMAMVEVKDTISPNAIAKNITVQLDASGSASLNAGDINDGSSDACGIASTSVDVNSFSCANVGANNVVLTVTDNNGNSSTATAVVTVEDNVNPNAQVNNITVQLDASGNASITATDIDNASSDACGIASTSIDVNSFSCANVGANNVVLTVTDNNGNSASAMAVVTVEDNIAPALNNVPGDISITAQPNDCTPSVDWTAPTASDNCSATLSSTANPNDNFPVGTTAVTYTATDASGNTVSASFNVTVTPTPVVVSSTLSAYAGGFNISCNGFSDGGIDLSVSGGCEPYSFNWSDGTTTQDNIGLSAGSYSVTVTDANGTVQNFSYTLTEPSPLSASAASSGYTNGTGLSGNTLYLGYGAQSINLSATVSGGVAPYTYSWSPAASLSGATTASPVASPMATTTYTATVTDANGCVITASTTVNVIDARCGKKMDKVLVCHKESKRKKGQVTTTYHNICVSINAVSAHLAHGDYLGPCNNSNKNGDDIVEAFDYHVYPNPTSDVFTVEIHSEVAGDAKFILTDVQGRIIDMQNETTAGGTTQYQFDLGRYAKGVYMLTIMANNQKFVERVIKQ